MTEEAQGMNLAKRFIEALRDLEENRNVDGIASLFAENAEVGNVTLTETLHGADGAREFWTNYRSTFGEVRSEFHNKILTDGIAALEWTTVGTAENGSEIKYDGVSILEMDGSKIKRFHAYFNPGTLGSQIERGAHA